MNTVRLVHLLLELQQGLLTPEEAVQELSAGLATAGHPEAAGVHVDLGRQDRCGFPEVVYAPGKTVDAIVAVFESQLAIGQRCYATRVSPEQAAGVLARFPDAHWNAVARTVRLSPGNAAAPTLGKVAVMTAGTSDRPIAEEAMETLLWMGASVQLVVDVGVAGPHRLLEKLPLLGGCDAVIVVAGMEGALPSVVGGWVDCPIIAVPTSVGYGASFQGVTALLGMLNSCASNVTVVNIDAGFKAGYVAGMISRQCARARHEARKGGS